MDNELFLLVMRIVISVCTALITAYVIPYLKTLRSDKRYAMIIDMVTLAVKAAEQTITDPGSGSFKKAKVIEFINKWLNSQGIVISDDELSDMIESAVFQMKQESKNEE